MNEYRIKLARAAITHDFDVAYGLMRLICKGNSHDVLNDPKVMKWIKDNNKQLVAILAFNLEK